MKELEVRIIDIDIDAIRHTLTKLNAVLVKKQNQVNNIYDFENKSLLKNKGYARIRTIEDLLTNTNHCYMTTKKLLSQDKYKIMEEHEIAVSDANESALIFNSLGLKLVQSIKKYRESYKYKSTLIEIDINDKSFCPFPYIEIETNNDDELKEIVHLLGYTLKDTTSKTIYEILKNRKVVKNS